MKMSDIHAIVKAFPQGVEGCVLIKEGKVTGIRIEDVFHDELVGLVEEALEILEGRHTLFDNKARALLAQIRAS